MQRKFWLFFTCFSTLITGFSQLPRLSPAAEVSVLTCGPGLELYTAFGHSAFRVQDPSQGIDIVYNYGTFDFNQPNFYTNFARGRMLYALSGSKFSNFLYTYQLENRWVKEQILNLYAEEKERLFRFLEENRKPENRAYAYDFLFDNCSTKIPEVLKKVLGEELIFSEDHPPDHYTFRELIRQNLPANSWASFGIDIALGAVIDRKATPYEHMFLPNYVMDQLNHSRLATEPLVTRERTILDLELTDNGNFFTSLPLFWLLLLLLFTVTFTVIDLKNGTRSKGLDSLLFLLTGFSGLGIVFLWFFTDHSATANNFNIFWAFPFNLIAMCFLILQRPLPSWFPKYMLLLLGLLILLLVFWLFGLQSFSPLIMVLLFTLGTRYAFLYWHLKNKRSYMR